MYAVAAQTKEARRGNIGRENVDGVPSGRTATAAPMALTPSLAEERPTKKRPAQSIGREIAEAATGVSTDRVRHGISAADRGSSDGWRPP